MRNRPYRGSLVLALATLASTFVLVAPAVRSQASGQDPLDKSDGCPFTRTSSPL
jgi:hypothetical protein